MRRAIRVLSAAERAGRPVADTVILDYAQRSAQKLPVSGIKGGRFEIDLAKPARLATDDTLLLDDGNLIEVVAAPEPLIEARAADLSHLARLAWHLGDRHVSAQLFANRIRVRAEASVEDLLKALGARLAHIEAPFEPEGGAYALAHDHAHGHAHGHHHGHDHHHHDH
ncbi:MAG: urease accessory protein UreE [Pseudolabrys sp.]